MGRFERKMQNFRKKNTKSFGGTKKSCTFALAKRKGAIAQLVEQRTENPCVPGSIPGGTTPRKARESESYRDVTLFLFCHFQAGKH